MKNHYEILEIDPTASPEEIDKAYNNLSKQFHPDKNGGVKYFDDLFLQIKDAYQVLSEEALKTNYDLEKGFIEGKGAEEDLRRSEPEILLFEVDKKDFEEGDEIKITWETKNADNVVINPFGEVETSGSKMYRLKNYRKEILTITLDINNSESGETATRSLTLQNKVTEIDFSNLDNNYTGGNHNHEEENMDYSNSYSQTSDINTPIIEEENFYSSRGRIRRSTYIVRAILLAIPAGMALAILESSSNYYSGYDETAVIFCGLALIVVSYFSILQYIKRLHDINMSGWWALLVIIPYEGGLFALVTLFIDGQKGPNKYGEDLKGRI